MVDAIVQTLTSFDTVETVEFLIDGQTRETLTHGTPVSGSFTGGAVNLESVDASASLSGAETVTLYFPDEGGRLLVPVTRTVWERPSWARPFLNCLKARKRIAAWSARCPRIAR